jgi:hypothetical protein
MLSSAAAPTLAISTPVPIADLTIAGPTPDATPNTASREDVMLAVCPLSESQLIADAEAEAADTLEMIQLEAEAVQRCDEEEYDDDQDGDDDQDSDDELYTLRRIQDPYVFRRWAGELYIDDNDIKRIAYLGSPCWSKSCCDCDESIPDSTITDTC